VRVALNTLYGRSPLRGVEYNRESDGFLCLVELLFVGKLTI